MWLWIILPIIFLLFIILITGYGRATVPRRASFEGIESPEAVQAYDRINRWPQFQALRLMVVNELKRHHPRGTIVDAGCGPGYLINVIAKSIPDLHIIGVDISEEMIKTATHNLSASGFGGRVEFRQGDVQRQPFADIAVEFVVSTLSLHHWQDPKPALQEIHRILKPGGQFLIFDLRRDSRRLFYWLIWFAQTFVVPAPMRQIKEPTGSVLSSYTPTEVENLLSETPFKQWHIKTEFAFLFIWGQKG